MQTIFRWDRMLCNNCLKTIAFNYNRFGKLPSIHVRENRRGNQEWPIWNYWEIQHRTKTHKTKQKHNTAQKTKKMDNTDPTKNKNNPTKNRVWTQVIAVYYKIPVVLLIAIERQNRKGHGIVFWWNAMFPLEHSFLFLVCFCFVC